MENENHDLPIKNKTTQNQAEVLSLNRKDKSILAIFFFTIAITLYFVAEILSEKDEVLLRDQASLNAELVNKHLKLTDSKIQMDEKKVETENFSALAIGQKIEIPYASNERAAEELIQSTADEEVSKLIRPDDTDYELNSPKQKIYNKMREQSLQSEYYENYKDAYVRAFIEKAKANGYVIHVDENLIVTSVRKVKPPSGPVIDPKKDAIRY
jgi:hypothetical protein